MNQTNNFVILLLLIEFSLAEDNVKIKDILKNSSKYFTKNQTGENDNNKNQNNDIFRTEMTKTIRECVSDGSVDDENRYGGNEGGASIYRDMDDIQHRRKQHYDYNYGRYNLLGINTNQISQFLE